MLAKRAGKIKYIHIHVAYGKIKYIDLHVAYGFPFASPFDGVNPESPSAKVTCLHTRSKKLNHFGENLINWTIWKIYSMQSRRISHRLTYLELTNSGYVQSSGRIENGPPP